jgi:hypothetical protein
MSSWNGPKRVTETETFTVDYAGGQHPRIAPGVTVVDGTAVWTCRAVVGVDPAAASMVIGGSTVSGAKVSNLIGPGVSQVTYQIYCTARMSDGQTLTLPEPGDDLLYVA